MTTRQRVADLEHAVYRLTQALGSTTEMLAEFAGADGPEGRDLVRAQALEALREMTVVLREIEGFYGPKV